MIEDVVLQITLVMDFVLPFERHCLSSGYPH